MIVGQEWIILAVLAIILLFGAKKLPEIARSLGRAKKEFERGKRELEKELREEEVKSSTHTSTTSSATTTPSESKIVKAARELGIETQGKSEEELKKEIAKKVGGQ